MSPLKSLPPPISPQCNLIAVLAQDGKPVIQDDGSQIFVDLDGGANHIEWSPNLRLAFSMHDTWIERGLDTYSLRVWKRRHGPLIVDGGGGYDWTEPAFTDPWADWLDKHSELSFLIAGVEFKIMSASPHRNGVEYWLTGRMTAL